MPPRPRLILPVLLGLLGPLAAGCGEDPFSPSEMRRATRALARWEARGFADYSYEIRSACFCGPEASSWAKVEVRGGVVTGAWSVETGAPYPAHLLGIWHPVDDLFGRILRDHDDEFLVDVRADFDPATGFPTYLSFSYDSRIADAGGAHYLRHLTPLE